MAAGAGGALAASRVFDTLLFGVSGTDAITLAGVAVVVCALSFVAAVTPARRALRVDPAISLRGD